MKEYRRMNVLFLSIAEFDSIYQRELYPDLLREFMNNGHEIYVVSTSERRNKEQTRIINEGHCHILKVKVGNITKSGMIEKGIATLLIESQFKNAISKYFYNIKFDLILYSTPPITLANTISFVKKRDNARTYLLLKDIFPQNAVDIGILSKTGIKGIIYRIFRKKEKKLYQISDYIGCMSQANVDYLLKHNAEIEPSKVEISPNCVDVVDMSVNSRTRQEIRNKYNIPLDKKVFIYGGNLGKPQGIDFMIQCLKSQAHNDAAFFVIVGDGTEFEKIETYINDEKPSNVQLMKRLPKDDYDSMVGACDVGMIFLDHRFTIPNFPSRLLSYMQAKIPILAVTDPNTDIGKIIMDGGFGWWCESIDVSEFSKIVQNINMIHTNEYGNRAWKYLCDEYSVNKQYKTIIIHN